MSLDFPLQITFHQMESSPALEQAIEEHAEKLGRHYDRIVRCRVVVECPHHHHRKGVLYHVSIQLGLPGADLVVNKDQQENHAHEDVYVAIRDAFLAATRQLEEFSRKRNPGPGGRSATV